MVVEQTPIPHQELVFITADLCLRILANSEANATEKASLTRTLLETTHCNPEEVKLAMELKIKAKATKL